MNAHSPSNYDRFWLLQNLEKEPPVELVFTAEHLAMHAAEKMVGNRSFATAGNLLFYDSNDGTVSVIVRPFTRKHLLAMGHNIPIE